MTYRSTRRRLIAGGTAVTLLATGLVVAGATGAAAAPISGFTLEVEGSGVQPVGGTFVAMPASAVNWAAPTSVSGGLVMTGAGTTLTLRPVPGTPLTSGTVATTNVSGIGQVVLTPSRLGTCTPRTGSLTISDVAYAGDVLTRLAADYEVRCGSVTTPNARGSIRFQSDASWSALPGQTTIPAGTVYRDEPLVVTSTFTNAGPSSLAVDDADAEVSGVGLTTGSIDDQCRGKVLASQGTCTVVATVVPTNSGTPGASITVRVPSAGLLGGYSLAQRSLWVTTRPAPPTAPTNLRAAPTPDGVALRWWPGGGLQGSYDVLRSVDGGAEQILGNVPHVQNGEPNYADTDVPDGAEVSYRVRGRNDGGAGPESEAASVTVALSDVGPAGSITAVRVDRYSASFPTSRTRHDVVTGSDIDAGLAGYGYGVVALKAVGGDLQGQSLALVFAPDVLEPGTHTVGPGADSWEVQLGSCFVTGTIEVLEAVQLADGSLTRFAADVSGTCGDGEVEAQLRYGTDLTWSSVALAITGDAGDVRVGRSADLVITATNDGAQVLNVDTDAVLDGPPAFSVVATTCPSSTAMEVGESCTWTVRYTPTAATGGEQATLDVTLQGRTLRSDLAGSAQDLPGETTAVQASASKGVVSFVFMPGVPNEGDDRRVELWRGKSTQSLTKVGESDTTRILDRGLAPGATYVYSLRTVTSVGAGVFTEPQSVAVPREAVVVVRDAGDPFIGAELVTAPTSGGVVAGPAIALTDGESVHVMDAAVSPDGEKVAFAVVGSGSPWVRVMGVDGGNPYNVTEAEGAVDGLSWSPDGKRLAYAVYPTQTSTGQLRVVDADLADAVPQSLGLASEPTWTSDGRSVVAVVDGSLSRFDVVTGNRTPIPSTTGLRDPDVSGDGKLIAASRQFADVSGQPVWRIVTLPIGGGVSTPISPQPTVGGIAAQARWRLDGSRIDYTSLPISGSGGAGRASIRWVQSDGSASGVVIQSASYDLYSGGVAEVDSVAPTASLNSLPAATTSASVAVSWTGRDLGSGVAKFDLRYRTISSSGTSSTRTWLADTTQTSRALLLSPGTQYCLSVRAKDRVGNVGPWSGERCVSSPMDDRSLTRSGFSLASGSSYYRSTVSVSSKQGAVLTRSGVKAKQVGLVVRTCSTCGGLTVRLGSSYLGKVSTRATSGYKRVIWLTATSSARSGTLTLTSTSSSKVYLDGVVLR